MRTLVIAFACLLVGACGLFSIGEDAAAPKKTALKLKTCKVKGVTERLLCGNFLVPEDRSKQGGRSVVLNVVVVPATGEKTEVPLYDLPGGPGLPATAAASFYATDGAIHRVHRDVVLVDPRGTGDSEPLDCPVKFADPLFPVLDVAVVKSCRDKLSRNADLSQYSTANIVADLDAVRGALGHDKINLMGLSYGTRIAQEYVRAHADHVRAMVLLGTLSPAQKLPVTFARDAEGVMQRLVQQCAADPQCRTAVPNLTADVRAVIARFADGPILVSVKGRGDATIEEGPFWEAVRAQLTTTSQQRRLPWLLHQAAQGDFAPIVQATTSRNEAGANGMLLSVSCPEDTLRITPAEIEPTKKTLFTDYRVNQQIAACREWGLAPLADPRPGPVKSDVPALLMAGDMDHATPLRHAREVAATLPHSRVVVVPNLGHFPEGLSHMDCYERIVEDFLQAASAEQLDLSCLLTMEAPPFKTAAD